MKNQTPLLTDYDLYLLREGTHLRSYEKMGAHIVDCGGEQGVSFSVWAPNAKNVSVIGDFNNWDKTSNPLRCLGESGVWQGIVPKVGQGACYKFSIESNHGNYSVEKADPYAFFAEHPPRTASRVWDISKYSWSDREWMDARANRDSVARPMTIYELHLGSWRRNLDNTVLTYRQLAVELVDYVVEMGFSHVEFMPLTEHPFDGSWGYQTTSYFAPTSRYGTAEDLMFLIDTLHQNAIGVILDWVPAHFPSDLHGLNYFDGTHLYEHSDPKEGFHPDWKTMIFNYGRKEVANFLISSALFWIDKYHFDGLRLDAVASMIYRDYSRKEGEWIPNKYGERENIEALSFLRKLNEVVYQEYPGIVSIAEESTSWPMVSSPTYMGGLGFGFKWNMGWMNDVLRFMARDSIHRSYHFNELTFSLLYSFHENFILPLSHDEVVHGKGSIVDKMPGDSWQKFANARLLYGFMYAHPGKKLLFMGNEIGQLREWNHETSLDWHLLEQAPHSQIQRWIKDLNCTICKEKALCEIDFKHQGFEWVDCSDQEKSVLSFIRWSNDCSEGVLSVCNFTPVVYEKYRVGVPFNSRWRELLNSDSEIYGGSGQGNLGGVSAQKLSFHGRPFSIELTLPPLSVLFLKCDSEQ